jgi:transcriptional regulator with XRE-family HTH domain
MNPTPNPYAHNIRRLMARGGMTLRDLVNASGLHERTVKAALNGAGKPHARTLHRLAVGLGVSADELFQLPAAARVSAFNRQTNGEVDAIVAQDPKRFAEWSEADFEELYSHFGMGGALTREGAEKVIVAINGKRAVHRKVALLLESSQSELLTEFVDLLYRKIAVTQL